MSHLSTLVHKFILLYEVLRAGRAQMGIFYGFYSVYKVLGVGYIQLGIFGVGFLVFLNFIKSSKRAEDNLGVGSA